MNNRLPERGNALFIILIAVALLAALSFAVTQSNQGGVASVTQEKSRLVASEILEYSKTMSNAVAQLRLRGCKDSKLSFANSAVNSYTNNSAPTDNTCHIFSSAGGGLTWQVPQNGATVTSPTPSNSWIISGNNNVKDVGLSGDADYSELVLFLNDVALNICQDINVVLKIAGPGDAPPEDSSINDGVYTGAYGFDETIGDEDARLYGQKAGCFKDNNTSKYVYYKVLTAR